MAMSADIRSAMKDNVSIWEFVASYERNQPDQLTLDLGIACAEEFGDVNNPFLKEHHGTTLMRATLDLYPLSIIYVGPLSESMEIVQPLLDICQLTHNITEISWSDIETQSRYDINALSCIKGHYLNVYGFILHQINVSSLIEVSDRASGAMRGKFNLSASEVYDTRWIRYNLS